MEKAFILWGFLLGRFFFGTATWNPGIRHKSLPISWEASSIFGILSFVSRRKSPPTARALRQRAARAVLVRAETTSSCQSAFENSRQSSLENQRSLAKNPGKKLVALATKVQCILCRNMKRGRVGPAFANSTYRCCIHVRAHARVRGQQEIVGYHFVLQDKRSWVNQLSRNSSLPLDGSSAIMANGQISCARFLRQILFVTRNNTPPLLA